MHISVANQIYTNIIYKNHVYLLTYLLGNYLMVDRVCVDYFGSSCDEFTASRCNELIPQFDETDIDQYCRYFYRALLYAVQTMLPQSVFLSVRPSVLHNPVLCQNGSTYRRNSLPPRVVPFVVVFCSAFHVQ